MATSPTADVNGIAATEAKTATARPAAPPIAELPGAVATTDAGRNAMAPAPEGLHRAHAVAAAAAQEWNSDLTIILSSVDEALARLEDLSNPTVRFLIDIRFAAQRCAVNAGILLDYGASRGLMATPTACQILARR